MIRALLITSARLCALLPDLAFASFDIVLQTNARNKLPAYLGCLKQCFPEIRTRRPNRLVMIMLAILICCSSNVLLQGCNCGWVAVLTVHAFLFWLTIIFIQVDVSKVKWKRFCHSNSRAKISNYLLLKSCSEIYICDDATVFLSAQQGNSVCMLFLKSGKKGLPFQEER